MKTAGSLYGFKHSPQTIELIRAAKLGKPLSEEAKIKLGANSQPSGGLLVDNDNVETNEVVYFTSIRSAAAFINMHPSYLAKCIAKEGFIEVVIFVSLFPTPMGGIHTLR